MHTQKPPRIPLPKGWPSHVKSGGLHIISLAHFSITHARGWAAKSISASVRIAAEKDRLHQEIALLREELRIKDAHMSVIAPPVLLHSGHCEWPDSRYSRSAGWVSPPVDSMPPWTG